MSMTQKEIYEKVQLLKAGQVVWIDGDTFKARRLPDDYELHACQACSLDCICKGNVALICSELDRPFYMKYILELAHP